MDGGAHQLLVEPARVRPESQFLVDLDHAVLGLNIACAIMVHCLRPNPFRLVPDMPVYEAVLSGHTHDVKRRAGYREFYLCHYGETLFYGICPLTSRQIEC